MSRQTCAQLPGPVRSLRPVTPAGILAHRLEGALGLARAADVPFELLDELETASALASGLEAYAERCTSPESPGLARLAARTRAENWEHVGASVAVEAEMLSGHVEGRLLNFLVAMSCARRVLEIGMFTGYSALAIAEALGVGGTVVACELDPSVAAFARECFAEATALDTPPGLAEIDVRVGPAASTLRELSAATDSFDLVFIDADKSGYLGYVDQVLEGGLLAPGGTICVDNTMLQGEPWLGRHASEPGVAISRFNAAIADDPRVEQVLLAVRDGVTLIRRTR